MLHLESVSITAAQDIIIYPTLCLPQERRWWHEKGSGASEEAPVPGCSSLVCGIHLTASSMNTGQLEFPDNSRASLSPKASADSVGFGFCSKKEFLK